MSVGSTGGSADFVQENHDKLCTLAAALKHLVEVIEAHEIESLSCDRDGSEYCDCLRNAATEAKRLLPNQVRGGYTTQYESTEQIIAAAIREATEQEFATINAERAESRDTLKEMIKAQDEVAKLRAEVERLKTEIGPLREIVGVRCDAESCPSDITNWMNLVSHADAAKRYKAALDVAEGALSKILGGIPGCHEGELIHVHYDGEGNELGVERIDPLTVIQCIQNDAHEALARIAALKDNSAKQ